MFDPADTYIIAGGMGNFHCYYSNESQCNSQNNESCFVGFSFFFHGHHSFDITFFSVLI